jgi:hypothetical protein
VCLGYEVPINPLGIRREDHGQSGSLNFTWMLKLHLCVQALRSDRQRDAESGPEQDFTPAVPNKMQVAQSVPNLVQGGGLACSNMPDHFKSSPF